MVRHHALGGARWEECRSGSKDPELEADVREYEYEEELIWETHHSSMVSIVKGLEDRIKEFTKDISDKRSLERQYRQEVRELRCKAANCDSTLKDLLEQLVELEGSGSCSWGRRRGSGAERSRSPRR